jgi:hypothetical protein
MNTTTLAPEPAGVAGLRAGHDHTAHERAEVLVESCAVCIAEAIIEEHVCERCDDVPAPACAVCREEDAEGALR